MTGFRGMRFVMDLMKRFTPKRESLTGNESLSDKQLEEFNDNNDTNGNQTT